MTTGADGTAAITWTGKNLGTDTLTAFTDLNGNGVRDANEPERTATVTWTAPPPPAPPVPGKSVVVKVVSGQVFIKLPGSGRARATGPPKGFVPFTGAANIPVGSQLDTEQGPRGVDVGGGHRRRQDPDLGLLRRASSRSSRPCPRRSPRSRRR